MSRFSSNSLFFLCVAIWGSTWFVIKFQLGTVPPNLSVAWRFILAGLLLLGLCRLRGWRLRHSARSHAWFAGIGLAMYCASYLCVYHAERFVVSGVVALGYCVSPLLNQVGGKLVFQRPFSGRILLSGSLGVVGTGLVFWQELTLAQQNRDFVLGLAFTAGAVLFSTIGVFSAEVFAISRTAKEDKPNVWQRLAWSMLYGGLICLFMHLVGGGQIVFDLRPAYLASLLYLVGAGSIIAFGSFLALLEREGSVRVGYIGVMVPIVAIGISAIFENYSFTLLTAVGIFVAVAGNLLALNPRAAPGQKEP